MKKIIGFVLALVMVVIIAVPVSASTVDVEQLYLEDAYQKNIQSVYYSTRFREAYTTLKITRSSQEAVLEFPDNYGGSYIDNDNDLHILYTDELNTLNIASVQEYAEFDCVNYSYNYLNDIVDILSDNLIELGITTTYMDEVLNKVVVCADENYKLMICEYLAENFMSFDDESLIFEEPTNPVNTALGGSGLSSSAGSFTLGYNAYDYSTGKYGFVTCGHAVSVGDTVYQGSALGTVTKKQFSGTIDAAFIEYSNQSQATANTMWNLSLTGSYSATGITTGMVVDKYGLTTGARSGRVTAGSVSIVCDGITFRDQVQMSIRQERGDSGALAVHMFIGPLLPDQTYPVTLIGITTFADSSTWETAFASKAANINSTFGLGLCIIV